MAVVIIVLFLKTGRLSAMGHLLCAVQIALLDNPLAIYSGYTYAV